MGSWQEFAEALGKKDHSKDVEELKASIHEPALVDVSPLGDRHYYSFLRHGVLLLFEQNVLDTITFYAEPHAGFHRYDSELHYGLVPSANESDVLKLLGPASASGGGRDDKLLGYMPRWVKYEVGNAEIHIEFSRENRVRNLSLIKR